MLVMGGLQYRSLRLLDQRRPEAPNSSGLDLKTERSGNENQWRFTWNRSSSAIRRAAKGHVSIIDGYLRKELEFTAADLQSGAGLIYAPGADDVTFRLEVFDQQPGRVVSESIRVVAGSGRYWSAAAIEDRLRVLNPAGEHDRASDPEPLGRGPEHDSGAESSASARPRNQGVDTAKPGDARNAPPLRSFTPPPRPEELVVVSRTVNDLPTPPALQWGAESPTRSIPALAAPLIAAISPPLPKPDQASSPPAVRSGRGGAGNPIRAPNPAGASVSAGEQSRGSAVEPPTLLHRTDPEYPILAAQKRVTGIVRVQATVGTDGHLHDPHVLSGPALLRGAAIEALKHWSYSPARINGRVVSASATIEMRFDQPDASH
jgi:protein TonB